MNIKNFTILLLVFGITGCVSDAMEKVLKERPKSTEAARHFILKWDQPNAKKIPEGLYTAKSNKSKGNISLESNLTYYFNDHSITIKGAVEGVTFWVFPISLSINGEADYSLNNGLISFTNVKGHGSLFPIDGTPYEVGNDGTIIIYEITGDGNVTKEFLSNANSSMENL